MKIVIYPIDFVRVADPWIGGAKEVFGVVSTGLHPESVFMLSIPLVAHRAEIRRRWIVKLNQRSRRSQIVVIEKRLVRWDTRKRSVEANTTARGGGLSDSSRSADGLGQAVGITHCRGGRHPR